MPLGFKLAPPGGVTSWNNRSKESKIYFVAKLTQVRDPGPSWPSYVIFKVFLIFMNIR